MVKIKKLSFKEACKKAGHHPVKSLPYPKPINTEEEAWNALKRLQIYAEAYNMVRGKKWVVSYKNNNQAKWRIWFRYDPAVSAFVFIITNFDYSFAGTAAGSRHVFRTDAIAEHMATAHIDEWNKWLVK